MERLDVFRGEHREFFRELSGTLGKYTRLFGVEDESCPRPIEWIKKVQLFWSKGEAWKALVDYVGKDDFAFAYDLGSVKIKDMGGRGIKRLPLVDVRSYFGTADCKGNPDVFAIGADGKCSLLKDVTSILLESRGEDLWEALICRRVGDKVVGERYEVRNVELDKWTIGSFVYSGPYVSRDPAEGPDEIDVMLEEAGRFGRIEDALSRLDSEVKSLSRYLRGQK